MKKVFFASIAIILAASFGIPNFSYAQTENPASPDFQLVPCTGVVKTDANGNRTGKECDFADLLVLARRIIQFALYLITPIVIGMILFTGFKYMTAGGDARLIEDAKRMFKPIIIGVIMIFAAWVTVYTVLDKLLGPMIGDIPKTDIVPTTIR